MYLNHSSNTAVNLDRNATFGVLPEVSEMLSVQGPELLNPSSIHQGGQKARYLVEDARDEVRLLLGCSPSDKVIFTSGATESNNTALFEPLYRGLKDCHIITSSVEHPSVLEPALKLRKLGYDVTLLTPNPTSGAISSESVISNLKSSTRIVSIMYANNETGSVFPVKEIGDSLLKKSFSGLFHVDAVQAVGRIPFSFSDLRIDLMSISGHKFGSLPGVGALIVRAGIEIEPLLYGGPQEKRSRAGTENVSGIISMGTAAKKLRENYDANIIQLREHREIVWSILRDQLPNIHPTVSLDGTIPNTLNIRIVGVNASDLVVALDVEGIAISSGAACASGKPGASHVLLALGLSEEHAKECIRLSVGWNEDKERLREAAHKIVRVIRRIRGE